VAKGYGRLDITTLTVLLRHRLGEEGIQRFNLCFDKDEGWTGWMGTREPDELKFFETPDSALLAMLIGYTVVPGVRDDPL